MFKWEHQCLGEREITILENKCLCWGGKKKSNKPSQLGSPMVYLANIVVKVATLRVKK